jgi:hypothetical protein
MKRRWRRILLALGIVAVACASYAWFFGFQTMMVLEMRWMARRAPVVRETPRALPDLSVSSAPGRKLSYFGYQFEVPWDDLDESKTKLYPNRVALAFRSGKSLVFSIAPPRYFITVVESMGKKDALRQIYGDAPLQSDYAMNRLILGANPDQVTLLTPRKEIVGTSILLVMKAIMVPEESGIFSLQTAGFQGFQYGNPQSGPRHVVANLFADDDGLEFIFGGQGKGYPLGISQADINRVLQTVRTTREKPSGRPSSPGSLAR